MALDLTQKTELEQNTEKQKLKNISAYALPNNVSDSNLTDDQIKKYFYQPVLALYDYLATLRTLTLSNDTELDTLITNLQTSLASNVEELQAAHEADIALLNTTISNNKTASETTDNDLQEQITTNKTNCENNLTDAQATLNGTITNFNNVLTNKIEAMDEDHKNVQIPNYFNGRVNLSEPVFKDEDTEATFKIVDTDEESNIAKLNAGYDVLFDKDDTNHIKSSALPTTTASKQDISDAIDAIDYSDYSTVGNTGYALEVSMDKDTYVVTIKLLNSKGDVLDTETFDLPLESVVTNGVYDKTNKQITLTLHNGVTVDIPVGDIVDGLQTTISADNKISYLYIDGLKTKLSEFTDDLGTTPTHTHSQYALKDDITNMVNSTSITNIEKVSALPDSPDANTLYIITEA